MLGHGLVEKEPLASRTRHRRVELHHVERAVGRARIQHVLGPRIAAPAHHEDAPGVRSHGKGVVKGTVVREHWLHPPAVEVGGALVDTTDLHDPHARAVLGAHGAHQPPPVPQPDDPWHQPRHTHDAPPSHPTYTREQRIARGGHP